MAGAAFSIKLRCASWQQLATIYKRDLSRGSMFLKASNQPAIGTVVRIDLELPSATVIELQGTIAEHVTDPQRGTGVNLKLEPLPTKSVWMIESALAAASKASGPPGAEPAAGAPSERQARPATLSDGEEISAAEQELIHALEAEAESLRKLNPFLVLGVGYETTDTDVRAAFGELTKRYHPDRFARYQSAKLRQIAAEIFILIRDAYRRLADDKSRQQVVSSLGHKPGGRAATYPRAGTPAPIPPTPPPPPRKSADMRVAVPPATPPKLTTGDIPTVQSPHEMPTNQSNKPAELASTELAKADQVASLAESVKAKTPAQGIPTDKLPPSANKSGRMATESGEGAAIEALIDEGKLEEAVAAFRVLAKKTPGDKAFRAGIELVEGLKALNARDRMEAAQRFEAALELDPGNERAARELADMRRHATNERKGLLSRLMGKKEPPP